MSKIISISDEVYELLSKMKGDKSFSVVIKDLASRSNKEQILAFAGKRMIDEDVVKELQKGWKKWRERSV